MLEEIENQRKKREEDTVKLMNEEFQMGQMGNVSISHYMASAPVEDYPSDAEFYRRPYKRPSVQLLITVATPVFDRRNFSNVTERIRSSKNIWIERTKEMRVANILGVAGTDVPIREIIKLTPPHKLGVNGYSFVVTNNGFVLYHPDLRPLFQDMLKPQYNTVDMTEVELVDDDKLGPREFDETLLG
ncbi:Voltage-dependent calcium channel subunit alpha-2/delta-3, partial [Stegodyphus mimosarum]